MLDSRVLHLWLTPDGSLWLWHYWSASATYGSLCMMLSQITTCNTLQHKYNWYWWVGESKFLVSVLKNNFVLNSRAWIRLKICTKLELHTSAYVTLGWTRLTVMCVYISDLHKTQECKDREKLRKINYIFEFQKAFLWLERSGLMRATVIWVGWYQVHQPVVVYTNIRILWQGMCVHLWRRQSRCTGKKPNLWFPTYLILVHF